MNFNAEKATRKWPCGSFSRTGAAILVTVLTALAMLCAQIEPAAAARKLHPRSHGPWSDLFGENRPKLRRAALPASVPLPKPRPADAPPTEPEEPAAGKQTPAEADKAAEQGAPAPPPPSACRLAL